MPLPADAALRLARLLVTEYGFEAEVVAAERADALAVIGNHEAALIWVRVSEIVEQMRTPCP
jgi:hypothetical protein